MGYVLTCNMKTNYRNRPTEVTIVEFDSLSGESLSPRFEEIAYQFVPAGAIQSPLSYR